MYFYGQTLIVQELLGFVESIKKGNNYNFLITAPSGCGKTDLVQRICKRLEPDEKKIEWIKQYKGEFYFNESRRVHVYDEVHELQDPESLYYYMDQRRYVIFLMTNEKGGLKEPLRNRCINFNFIDYTLNEGIAIARNFFSDHGIHLSDEMCQFIAEQCNLIPRVIVNEVGERLLNLFRMKGVPQHNSGLVILMEDYLGIINGLNVDCRRYLDFLSKRDKASLDLICSSINLEKDYVRKNIEPILVKKGLIEITSRGRMYVDDSI